MPRTHASAPPVIAPREPNTAIADIKGKVLALAEVFLTEKAQNPDQRRVLLAALQGLRKQIKDEQSPPFIFLPVLVYSGVAQTKESAFALAAAMVLLFLGVDIHDDLADGDLPPSWRHHKTSEIHLTAATLLSSLPQLALSELDTPPHIIAAMQRTLAYGLLRMSAGQQRDLAFADRPAVSAEEVESSVEGKSGEELALFASLAAQLAQAPHKIVETYSAMGRAFGAAGQLSSDCFDIFDAKWSRDLANGTRTLPIALHLERLKEAERGHFLRLLGRAKESLAAQAEVRQRLREAGELRHCAFVIEIYCQRALARLKEAAPKEPAAAALRSMIKLNSLFHKKHK